MHQAALQGNAQRAQEASKGGVDFFRETVAARFDADGLAPVRHLDRIGMTAETRLLFDQSDIVIVLKQPRCRSYSHGIASIFILGAELFLQPDPCKIPVVADIAE